ncbi:hypothetical protein KSS87_009382 [Heliosperma pusillum]|nr:hypothetical protein KSS87_009382 [Heliosperma pusillum]
MQTMSNEAKKTHCSHKELQCNNGERGVSKYYKLNAEIQQRDGVSSNVSKEQVFNKN